MNDKEVDAHCQEWLNWCYTRKFYVPPGAQNILARMQPSKTGIEPNARNSADMQFFNAAIHSMADMPEHAETFACFRLMYIEDRNFVKVQAANLGISRVTYYSRSRTFARAALSLARSLKSANEIMQRNDEIAVD